MVWRPPAGPAACAPRRRGCSPSAAAASRTGPLSPAPWTGEARRAAPISSINRIMFRISDVITICIMCVIPVYSINSMNT